MYARVATGQPGRGILPAMLLVMLACAHAPRPASAPTPAEDPVVQRLFAGEGDRSAAWLATLCDEIGARPAGSDAVHHAEAWALSELRAVGAQARLQDVPLDVWLRGEERLVLLSPVREELAVLGLGGSVGTPGLEAPVVVVRSFDELGPQVAGKFVLYDVPMEEGVPTIARYGTAVAYRSQGAARAAEHGAVGAFVRSVTTRSLYTPHTGGMSYVEGVPRIPAAAVTVEDAARISRLSAKGVEVRLRLEMGARVGEPAVDHNVIAEVPGRELPGEIVLLGAHLDSWDVGTGAHDDGAGVVEVMEALRRIAALDERPRRTVRVVLFANEERGLHGGKAYEAAFGGERHVAAFESDLGGGPPLSWSVSGTEEQVAWLRRAAAPAGLPVEHDGGGGADISPLARRGVLLGGLRPDDRHYFDVHHTEADTFDKVDATALSDAAGRLAVLAWGLANAPPAPAASPP